MKKITALLLAVLMVAALCVGCGDKNEANDDSWTKVETAGKFILGLDDSFPPMGYRDTETGEIVGFDIDVAQEVCDRLGIELVKQPIDWDSNVMELDSGNIDCIWNGLTSTPSRQENMNLAVPYMLNTQVIMVLNDSQYQAREDLAGKTVGVQSGSSGENAINGDGEDQVAFKESLKEVVGIMNYTNALTELKNGTIDAIVIDEVVADKFMEDDPGAYRLLQKDGKDDFLTEEEYVIGFRKGDEALKNKIVDTLKEMKADGKLAEISTKWFGGDITTI